MADVDDDDVQAAIALSLATFGDEGEGRTPETEPTHTAMLEEFSAVTGSELPAARAALEAADWDMARAVDMFFEGMQYSPQPAEEWPAEDCDFLDEGALEGVPCPFSVGQSVTTLDDVGKVRELAEGHGGWEEWMAPYCGQAGIVTDTDRDGDVRVEFEKPDGSGLFRLWFNPLALVSAAAEAAAPSPEPEPPPPPPRKLEQPTPPIEGRAVTFDFLRRLTSAHVTDQMKVRATAAAVKYYESCGEKHIPSQCPGRHTLERCEATDVTPPSHSHTVTVTLSLTGSVVDGRNKYASGCDICTQVMRPGEIGYECQACNYTQCEGCWTRSRDDAKRRTAQQQRDFERRQQPPYYITGRDFHREVVKVHTHNLLCRYVELAGCGDGMDSDGSPSVGLADAFVSWNWDSDWEQMLAALGEHTLTVTAAGRAAPHYWLDLFAVNQHTALPPWRCESGLAKHNCPGCASVEDDMMSLSEMEGGRRDKGFERVINSENCRETLLILEPWFDPRPVTRVWCLYEMLLTMLAEKKLTMLAPPEQRGKLSDALLDDITNVERTLVRVDAEHAEATMEDDRVKIFASIRLLLPGGFAELNERASSELRRWTFAASLQALDELRPQHFGRARMMTQLAAYIKREGGAEHMRGCEGMQSLPESRPPLGDDSCSLCLAQWLRRESLRVTAAEGDYGILDEGDESTTAPARSSMSMSARSILSGEALDSDDWGDTGQSSTMYELEKILALGGDDEHEHQIWEQEEASSKSQFLLSQLGIELGETEPEPELEPEPEPRSEPGP